MSFGKRSSFNNPSPERLAQFQQKIMDAFNNLHPVGTQVAYWRGMKEGPPSGCGKTRTPAQLLSGETAVVWIEGCSGAIAISHIEVQKEAASEVS